MTKNYDLPHELTNKLEKVLCALRNVPLVGDKYDQQHSDCHVAAEIELLDVIKEFKDGNLVWSE